MKIYLDLVIIINYLFDFLLLSSTNYILRRNTKTSRLILSSLIGSITIIVLFIKLNSLTLVIFKVLLSLLMNIAAFGYQDFKYTCKNVIYFYLVSMLLGGVIYALNIEFNYNQSHYTLNKLTLYNSYIFIILLSIIIYHKYLKSFQELKNNYSNYYKCKIYFPHNQTLEVNAFLDTGNKLTCPYSNKSIILIHEDKLLHKEEYKPIFVPYNSLNNHGLLTCYQVDKIEIDGKSNQELLVGISHENFFLDGIDCIINNRVMEGLK